MRGNVVDLAVGIIIGVAFTAIIGSLIAARPPLQRLFGWLGVG